MDLMDNLGFAGGGFDTVHLNRRDRIMAAYYIIAAIISTCFPGSASANLRGVSKKYYWKSINTWLLKMTLRVVRNLESTWVMTREGRSQMAPKSKSSCRRINREKIWAAGDNAQEYTRSC